MLLGRVQQSPRVLGLRPGRISQDLQVWLKWRLCQPILKICVYARMAWPPSALRNLENRILGFVETWNPHHDVLETNSRQIFAGW